MNNPLSLVQAMRNPQQFLQQAMNNSQLMSNPIAKNAIEMYQNGDKAGINQMAANLCREKGTTMEEMTKKIMSHIGMN